MTGSASVPHLEATADALGLPFSRYRALDPSGREITFYLSDARPGKALPLALLVQGSGCESVFWRRPDGSVALGLHGHLLRLAAGRLRVMAVEKPGVPFLHQTSSPGSCAGCPPEFLRAYRFDRWLETLVAAVNATRALPDIAPAPLLVAGVSEGCLMAAHVAANIAAVTHVALLSAEGAPQLTHFVWDAWDADGSAEERHAEVERLFEMFEGMRRRPDNMDDWWLGHPHQRWATFAMQSTVDGLARTGAQIYVAYGTEDLPRSGDLLRANLLAMGKEFVAERILGGDHCLRVPDAGRERDIREVLERVIGWSVGVLAAHER